MWGGAKKNPPVTASPCQPPLGKGGKGTGDADCHGQFANWPRNDSFFYKGCGGAGDRKGRPYGGVTRGAMGGRTESSAPTEGYKECGGTGRCGHRPLRKRILRCVGEGLCPSRGRPQGSPLRTVTRGAAGGSSGRPTPTEGLQEVRGFMPGRRWWGCCSRVYRHPHGGGGCGW